MKAWRSVGTRLTAGYVLLLLLSMGLLYALAFWQMQRVLLERDHTAISTEIRNLIRHYREGGPAALREEAVEDSAEPFHSLLYTRLGRADGTTVFAEPHGAWPEDLLDGLERLRADSGWHEVPFNDEGDLELYSQALPGEYVLQVGSTTASRRESMEDFQSVFALAAVPVLVLGLFGGILLARHVLRPLRELTDVTRRISTTGEMAQRVPLRGSGDDLDELARLFNQMLDRIVRLIDRLRDTLDNVAHDLRTPLTRLRGRAELVLQDPTASSLDFRETLADSLEASEQVLTILNTIMDIAEAGAGTLPLRRETMPLRTLVDGVVDIYAYVAEEKGVELESEGLEDVAASVDPQRMGQALANLVDNAVKYTPRGGQVKVIVFAANGEAGVRVTDTGIGISVEDLPRIWERLYRGDRSRSERGLGLGLSLVQAVVTAHGGRVTAANAGGRGSVFTVWLPRAS